MFSFYHRLSSTHQRGLITFILSLFIVLVVIVAIPAARAIVARHAEIQSALELMEQQYQEAQKSKRTLRELSTVLERITPFTTAYLKKEHERQFITDLETLATTHSVTQTFSIEPSKPQNGIKGSAYTISVRAQGSYVNTMKYLHALQQQPITISINTIELTTASSGRKDREPQSNTNPQISLLFSGTIYADK